MADNDDSKSGRRLLAAIAVVARILIAALVHPRGRGASLADVEISLINGRFVAPGRRPATAPVRRKPQIVAPEDADRSKAPVMPAASGSGGAHHQVQTTYQRSR
jgi:hypothetical protein